MRRSFASLRMTVRRVRAALLRGRIERDMQEEMRAHLEQATERLIARGLSPTDAAAGARREFGNVTVHQEDARDARGARWMDALAGDLRFALRHFSHNKLTVAIIVSVFALGIGANTAIVTAIQGVFLRPAPVVPRDAAHVRIAGEQRATRTARWSERNFSYAELQAIAARRETFASVAGWLAHDVVLNPGDSIGPRGVSAQFVTPGYFGTLGVGVVAGGGFTAPDDGTPDLSAVMSFATAEQLYGMPTSAVGQRVRVNDMTVRVVGVAPPAFQGALRDMGRPALWIPASARADIARVPARWLIDGAHLELFGRLAPDVTHNQAAAIASLVVTRTLPDSATRVGMSRTTRVVPLSALLGDDSYEAMLVFSLVSLVGLLLLLVTCTNVSSLMVAAAVARRHEIAVRLSLGASRARIVRQLLTETTLLAVAGGSAGLLVCWWLLTLLADAAGSIDGIDMMPDAATFAVTFAIAIGTGVVFGLSPALHATQGAASHALRDSGSGASHRSRLQRTFVVAQIVFSLPLLLMLGVTLSAVIAEFQPLPSAVSEHVVRAAFRPLSLTGAPGQRREAVDSLAPSIAEHPEVLAVVPDDSWFLSRRFARPVFDSVGDVAHVTLSVRGAAPGWFAVLGVPVILGRDVSLADTAERDWPVVIGSDLARTLFGKRHPIGHILDSPGRTDSVRMVVVGVYDAALMTTGQYEQSNVFTAQGKRWRRDLLLIRTRSAAEPMLPEFRRLIRDRAPGVPLVTLKTQAHVDAQERRVTASVSGLVGAAGALALLLASLGLYGVIALSVRQRTREIGIRIAVGAEPARVAGMFLASGVRLGVVALAIGLPLSMLAMRLFLSQVELLAPKVNLWLISAAVSTALLVVATAATWLPARRASRVDPALTLRTE